MTPDTIAKTGSEHAHQTAFFSWLNTVRLFGFEHAKIMSDGGTLPRTVHSVEHPAHPELALFHAIPNGGSRHKAEAAKLKAEGVKAGVLDTFLPVPRPFSVPDSWAQHTYHGLYIEFKDPKRRNHKNGALSDKQMDFISLVATQGYCTRVAYTWREAANLVALYYGVDTRLKTL